MRPDLRTSLVVLMALAGNSVAKAQKLEACSLLNSSEIGDIARAKVGEPRNSDMVINNGPSKGQTVGGCMWRVGDQGMANVNVMSAPKGAAREEGLARLRAAYETLKSKGWTEEKETISNGSCSLMTPPSTDKDTPQMTGCIAEAKGIGISVGLMGKDRTPIATVKVLLEKAIARLP